LGIGPQSPIPNPQSPFKLLQNLEKESKLLIRLFN